jgi:hypothetical protein
MIEYFTSGGQSEFFTDWDSARQFVQDTVIGQNPRISNDERVELLAFEDEAYNATAGQWLASESREIADYYAYLTNNIRVVTDDEGILATFGIASEGAAEVADANTISPDDVIEGAQDLLTPSEDQVRLGRNTLLYVAGLGLLYVVLVKK